jgi:hypothetical protein
MKHRQQTVEVLTTAPFQAVMPGELAAASADGYYTFRAELWWGICGIEGELALLVYERGQVLELTGGPEWWACLGFGIVPDGQEPELRLFFLASTFFDRPHEIVARWNAAPLAGAALRLDTLVNNRQAGSDLKAAWQVIRQLLAEKFPLREIVNPAAQVPGYRHQDHSAVFGSS